MNQLSSLIGLISTLLDSGSDSEVSGWLGKNISAPGGRKVGLVQFLMGKIMGGEENKLAIRLLSLIVLLVVKKGSEEQKNWVYLSLSTMEGFWEVINSLLVSSSISLKTGCLNLVMNAYSISLSSLWPMRVFSHFDSAKEIIENDETSFGKKYSLTAFKYLSLLYLNDRGNTLKKCSALKISTIRSIIEISDQLEFGKYHYLFDTTDIEDTSTLRSELTNFVLQKVN